MSDELNDLIQELKKDPDFLAEYHRQKPYYDLLVAIIKHCEWLSEPFQEYKQIERLVAIHELKTSFVVTALNEGRKMSMYYDPESDDLHLTAGIITNLTVVHYVDDYLALLYEPHNKEIVGFKIEGFQHSAFARHKIEPEIKCCLEEWQGCCCQCRWRLTDYSHPLTDGKNMLEKRGYICIAFTQMEATDLAHSGWCEHGMCELFMALPESGKRGIEDKVANLSGTGDIFKEMAKELYQPTFVVSNADQTLTYKRCKCFERPTDAIDGWDCPLHGWMA